MNKIIALLSIVMFAGLGLGNTVKPDKGGIEFFEGTFKEAMEKAKKENKLIFLDTYASWCGPCKRMSAYVFTNEEVGKYFNENFVNVKMDMEKGEGPALAAQLRVSAYPTLFFIDGYGNGKYTHVGYLKADDLLSLGKEVLK